MTTDPVVLAPIVEGHGEVEAVPVLLRRLVPIIDPTRRAEVKRPIRVSRDKFLKPEELERHVDLAMRRCGHSGAVLVVLDADDDCPARRGPEVLARARAVNPDVFVSVVFAMREFEGWFIAAANSLRGRRGLPDDLRTPVDPETIRDAKSWIQSRRTDRYAYSPTSDQPALAALFDVEKARSNAPSFDKLWRDLERFLHVAA